MVLNWWHWGIAPPSDEGRILVLHGIPGGAALPPPSPGQFRQASNPLCLSQRLSLKFKVVPVLFCPIPLGETVQGKVCWVDPLPVLPETPHRQNIQLD